MDLLELYKTDDFIMDHELSFTTRGFLVYLKSMVNRKIAESEIHYSQDDLIQELAIEISKELEFNYKGVMLMAIKELAENGYID